MKSLLMLDSNPDRICQLGLLLRLARWSYHVVGSAEEACNHLLTVTDASRNYNCLLINNADSTGKALATLQLLRQCNVMLPLVLVERFDNRTDAGAATLKAYNAPNLVCCAPATISETLARLPEAPAFLQNTRS